MEATARLGNMSDTVVNRLAEKAWCAAQASPRISTAGPVAHRPFTAHHGRDAQGGEEHAWSCARG